MRIEIHDNENDVVARSGHLAVKENGVVLGVVEPQIRRKAGARGFRFRILFSRVIQSLMFPGAFQSRSLN